MRQAIRAARERVRGGDTEDAGTGAATGQEGATDGEPVGGEGTEGEYGMDGMCMWMEEWEEEYERETWGAEPEEMWAAESEPFGDG